MSRYGVSEGVRRVILLPSSAGGHQGFQSIGSRVLVLNS